MGRRGASRGALALALSCSCSSGSTSGEPAVIPAPLARTAESSAAPPQSPPPSPSDALPTTAPPIAADLPERVVHGTPLPAGSAPSKRSAFPERLLLQVGEPGGLTADDHHVYMAIGDRLQLRAHGAPSPAPLWTAPADIADLAQTTDHVLVSTRGAPSHIVRVAKSGGAAVVLARVDDASPRLAVGRGHVYWCSETSDSGGRGRVPLTGGAPEVEKTPCRDVAIRTRPDGSDEAWWASREGLEVGPIGRPRRSVLADQVSRVAVDGEAIVVGTADPCRPGPPVFAPTRERIKSTLGDHDGVIARLTMGAGDVQVTALARAETCVHDLLVDGERVYWSEPRSLRAVGRDGNEERVVALGKRLGHGMALHGGDLFMVDDVHEGTSEHAEVRMLPAATAMPRPVLLADDPKLGRAEWHMFGTALYGFVDSKLLRIDVTNGAVTTVAAPPGERVIGLSKGRPVVDLGGAALIAEADSETFDPSKLVPRYDGITADIAMVGDAIFAVHGSGPGAPAELTRTPLSGGKTTVVHKDLTGVTELFTDGRSLCFFESEPDPTGGTGPLYCMSAPALKRRRVDVLTAGKVVAMAGTDIVYAQGICNNGMADVTITRSNAGGRKSVLAAQFDGCVSDLHVDGDRVHWTNQMYPRPSEIYETPLDGGPSVMIAFGPSLQIIGSDERHLYLATEKGPASLPR